MLKVEQTRRQTAVTVRLHGPLLQPGWDEEDLGLEDIVLAYLDHGRRALEPQLSEVVA